MELTRGKCFSETLIVRKEASLGRVSWKLPEEFCDVPPPLDRVLNVDVARVAYMHQEHLHLGLSRHQRLASDLDWTA
jgi:hypothetical protein